MLDTILFVCCVDGTCQCESTKLVCNFLAELEIEGTELFINR